MDKFYKNAVKVAMMSRSLSWAKSVKEVFDWGLLSLSERVDVLYKLRDCTPTSCANDWYELVVEAEDDLDTFAQEESEAELENDLELATYWQRVYPF